MALQRPLKEGNVRTYQEKVALNFKDILASEADADHDTMYAAWNGALSGDLTGTLPNPTVTAAAKSKWTDTGTVLTPSGAAYANKLTLDNAGNLTLPRVGGGDAITCSGAAQKGHIGLTTSPSFAMRLNANLAGTASDDTTKPSWTLQLDIGDQLTVWRAPATAGAPAFAQLLALLSNGDFTITGATATK